MADLSKEWCEALIAHFKDPDREELGPLAAEQAARLVSIAARVLDEGAVGKLTELIEPEAVAFIRGPGAGQHTTADLVRHGHAVMVAKAAARAIIKYLTTEEK